MMQVRTVKEVTVLVDADPLVYRVGFACEHAAYTLTWADVDPAHRDDPDYDTVRTGFFDNAERCEEYQRLLALDPAEVLRERNITPEPLSYCLRSLRESVDNIQKFVAQYLSFQGQRVGATKLYLTGGNQFRDKLATIKPYKGNRDRSKRPFWYKEIREYLVSVWEAEVCEIIEADDAVALGQWQTEDLGDSIICTLDKDLRMVPGYHYSYYKQKAERIGFEDALHNFYKQLLLGDSSDNIPGLHRVGDATVKELLPVPLPEKEMFEVALQAYSENMERFPERHAPHTDPLSSLIENGRLLWMMDQPDRLWTPPGMPEASLQGFLDSLPPGDPDA